MWQCGNCKEKIEDKYKNCWNCGRPKPSEPQIIEDAGIIRDEPEMADQAVSEVEPIVKAAKSIEVGFLSGYSSPVDEKPPSKIIKLLPFLLWFLAFVATIIFGYLSTAKTNRFLQKIAEEAKSFNNQKDQFTFLKTALVGNSNLQGKVLPLNLKNTEVDGLFSYLPDDLRPTNPDEVKTLMWLDCKSEKVGQYTDGTFGWRENCKVYLVEKDTSKIIGIEDFLGIFPERSKERDTGDATGKVMPEKYLFYLRQKQPENERTEMKYSSDSPNHHIFNKSEFLLAFLGFVFLGAIGLGWIAYKIKFDWDAD